MRQLRSVPARLGVVLATTVASVVPLLALEAPVAGAACATRTTRAISGTVTGTDNLDVNVTIGFDVETSTGVIIDATPGSSTYGCKKTGGYSVKQLEKNRYLDGEGKPAGSPMYDYTGAYMGKTTRTWKLGSLPSNAKYVWIEVYARKYRNTGCKDANGNWCFGLSDTHKYGYVMRRRIAVGSTGVALRLPRNCGYGGSNGAISGTVKTTSGTAVTPSRAFAWSTATDSNSAVLGWGSGLRSSGKYTVPALASKQSYTVWVTYNGVTQKKSASVAGCKTTPLSFVF